MRALQDWFLKFELTSVPNVAEVATLGGVDRQYQVVLDPARLRAHRITLDTVINAIRDANGEASGSVLELAEAEYRVRPRGDLKTLDDFRSLPVGLGENGTPILLRDVATVQLGPETRRGIAELDGEGEVVGGGDELVQMLQNLLDNAVKYGSEAGRIELTARPDERKKGHVLLAIRDFGQGIEPEHVPRLTERFYRVSVKTSRARGGTGLGLAIVKHIVNRHQGELRIDSTPGKGSCFMTSLPLAAKQTGRGDQPRVAIDIVPQLPVKDRK